MSCQDSFEDNWVWTQFRSLPLVSQFYSHCNLLEDSWCKVLNYCSLCNYSKNVVIFRPAKGVKDPLKFRSCSILDSSWDGLIISGVLIVGWIGIADKNSSAKSAWTWKHKRCTYASKNGMGFHFHWHLQKFGGPQGQWEKVQTTSFRNLWRTKCFWLQDIRTIESHQGIIQSGVCLG